MIDKILKLSYKYIFNLILLNYKYLSIHSIFCDHKIGAVCRSQFVSLVLGKTANYGAVLKSKLLTFNRAFNQCFHCKRWIGISKHTGWSFISKWLLANSHLARPEENEGSNYCVLQKCSGWFKNRTKFIEKGVCIFSLDPLILMNSQIFSWDKWWRSEGSFTLTVFFCVNIKEINVNVNVYLHFCHYRHNVNLELWKKLRVNRP